MGSAASVVDPAVLLRELYTAAVAAGDPATCVPRNLPPPPPGRTIVVGAGKAAAAMASAAERHWSGSLTGLVVTAAGCEVPCRRIEVLVSGHPVPVEAGRLAAERILSSVRGLGPHDLVLCLVSGGGSALLTLPAAGLTIEDKQAITRALLASGATISEVNCVRRHLSGIKGGRLAAACYPAKVVTLAISDVPGDFPMDIASGPTVADPTTCADALAVLDRYRIDVPRHVRSGLEGGQWESVKPDSPRMPEGDFRLVATPQQALEAAAAVATVNGVAPLVLSDRVEGEAREVGREMAMLALAASRGEGPVRPPCVLLSGGETTVTVRGTGRGGRNVEFLLSFGCELGPASRIHALACDTDGVDGMEPVAGAIWYPDSLRRAASLGLDARAYLDANDAHSFFAALGDSVVTGPTRTNVNDFRAILMS